MYEGVVQDLIDELGRLPGVGPKSAQRIAFHLLATESADVSRLVAALTRVQQEAMNPLTEGLGALGGDIPATAPIPPGGLPGPPEM